ncbi:GNAT family N-acetyltransferase [Amaricoccus sp.]|uniref:GNAT family N-acetyltransferase n=1 Tax=Amaricoccus sp. TaxID=1872485 RepID=UPI001B5ED18A|nr:GNAT family N-acetyltransferase [Amaricoccus sp.]MBP7001607.1 GNAT family N-acetyltransferase [Amaricoccus sp.]
MAGPTHSVVIRAARREDAPDLARLFDIAGEGLPSHFWSGMAGPGEAPLEVGTRRAARDAGTFSWRNGAMATIGGATAGALVGYRIAAAEPVEEAPPIFRPLQALENRAVGAWYVNILAAYPAFRRRGVATALLGEAARRDGGRGGLALIVADGNAAALRAYEAFGFAAVSAEPIVTEPGWTSRSGCWLLMRRPASPA